MELDLPYPRNEGHLVLRHGGGVTCCPWRPSSYRVMVDHWPGRAGSAPDAEEMVAMVGDRLGLGPFEAAGVRWASAFTMQRRVAERFRTGRVLLAGDAAHICPPIGGQGLNSGVADVIAWAPALAAAINGVGDERSLDAVAERRRRACLLSGWVAWGAVLVDAPRSQALARARDAVAPVALRVGRRPLTAWLSGALDR